MVAFSRFRIKTRSNKFLSLFDKFLSRVQENTSVLTDTSHLPHTHSNHTCIHTHRYTNIYTWVESEKCEQAWRKKVEKTWFGNLGLCQWWWIQLPVRSQHLSATPKLILLHFSSTCNEKRESWGARKEIKELLESFLWTILHKVEKINGGRECEGGGRHVGLCGARERGGRE